MARTTMGALTEMQPPDKEKLFFNNVITTLDEVYPNSWRAWVINSPTYEDLFGESITSDLECRLRFAIPKVKLAKAYSSETTPSERRYRRIKKILISWPLGRALIYAPLTIMAKVHPTQAYNQFTETINMIKRELISRQDASKILRGANDAESASISGNSRASKISHSPDPPTTAKEPKMSDYMAQQNLILEKLCMIAVTKNENVRSILNKDNRSPSVCSSQDMRYLSTSEGEASTSYPVHDAEEDNWTAPPLLAVPLQRENRGNQDSAEEPLQDFTPGTKESDSKITKAQES